MFYKPWFDIGYLDMILWSYFKVPHKRVITNRRMRLSIIIYFFYLFLPERVLKRVRTGKNSEGNKLNSSHEVSLIAGKTPYINCKWSARKHKYSNIKALSLDKFVWMCVNEWIWSRHWPWPNHQLANVLRAPFDWWPGDGDPPAPQMGPNSSKNIAKCPKIFGDIR